MAVTLAVYGLDLTTLLGVLDQPYRIEWMREQWDSGSGSFYIPSDSPFMAANPNLFDDEVVVEVRRDGVPSFLWLPDKFERERGDVWDPLEFAGPGAIELFRRMMVYPYHGVDAVPVSDSRVWSWTAFEYPDDTWATIEAESPRVGSPLSTSDWPDAETVGYEPAFPGERTLYRRLCGGASETTPARMLLAAAWNTEVTVYVDGEEVLSKPAGKTGIFAVDMEYVTYDRVISAEVKGVPGSAGAGRWGWTWVELQGVDEESGEPIYGSVLRRTYDPADYPNATRWKTFSGDQPYPGITPGWILLRLLEEGQARGMLTGVTTDFTADFDSAGALWPRTTTTTPPEIAPGKVELAANVFDDSWLDIAERMSDLGVEVELSPDRVLHAWQDRGVDRTASVDVTVGSEITARSRRNRRNVLVARTARSFIERTVAGGERREGFVSLGLIPSDEGATRIADDLVAEASEPLNVYSFGLHPGVGHPTPSDDFDLGDSVSGLVLPSPAAPWAPGPVTVQSLYARIGETGDEMWVVEVKG